MGGDAASTGCAAAAGALDEPLAGTAPTTTRWLAVEDTGPWPRDPVRHRDPSLAAFLHRADAAGFRPLLIRRPGADRPPPLRTVVLADTGPAGALATTLSVSDPAQLAGLPLPGAGVALPGAPLPAPLLLVCADDRDPCCAGGHALAAALHAAGEPGVWECSHLGGHRFAPTALVLPTGYLYGRLDAAAAIEVRDAAAAGEVRTDRCRGRSTWSAEGQVAELAVRAETGLRAADALAVQEPVDDAVAATVTVTDATGRRWAVHVVRVHGNVVRPPSCGARPTLVSPLRAARTQRLPSRPRPASDHPTGVRPGHSG